MLKQRVITAAVGVPLVIAVIWFGDPWFSLLTSGVVLAGTFEFYRMANFDKRYPLIYFGLLWALAIVLSSLILHYKGINTLPIVMAGAIIISLIWIAHRPLREKAFFNWAWMVAGVLYVGWMLTYWLNLRFLEDGRNWVYLALLTTFANDSGAFFIGRTWGKHHLASAISPSKTWEGALGGLLSAILGAIVITIILNFISPFTFKIWQVVIFGCLVSIFAQLGDLVESLLKRNMGVRESGNLLPGHGGILDRFDSLIFVGVLVYYYVNFTL